jgi:hypothetical protein
MASRETALASDPLETPDPDPIALAEERQREYARSRRDWAEAVGRPYARKSDPRPPPGELDAVADE